MAGTMPPGTSVLSHLNECRNYMRSPTNMDTSNKGLTLEELTLLRQLFDKGAQEGHDAAELATDQPGREEDTP